MFPFRKETCLDTSQKVAVRDFAKQHLNLGDRKIADHFGTAKPRFNLQSKESITTLHESNVCRNQVKTRRTAKYSAVWDWHTLCRQSNIPFSGAMLQNEAIIIAERLGISDFMALNSWIDRFKRQRNTCNMTIPARQGM